MSPIREVALVVGRELKKNLRSAKGVVVFLLCILGSIGTTLVALNSQEHLARRVGAEGMRRARTEAVAAVYGKEVGVALADVPEVLFVMLIGTIALAPMLAAIVGFDSVSSEMQHRAVRYWTVRTRRASYVIGKFLGLFAVASVLTLLTHLCSWIVTTVKSDIPVDITFLWGVRLWLTTLPVSAAWCALVIFFSGLFRSPILALLMSFLGWLACGLFYIIGRIHELPFLKWLYPNSFDRLLLSPAPDEWAVGLGASALFASAFMGLALVIFQRRDV